MAFDSLTDKLNSIFSKLSGKGKLTESDVKSAMREVKMALLEADVNFKVVKGHLCLRSCGFFGNDPIRDFAPAPAAETGAAGERAQGRQADCLLSGRRPCADDHSAWHGPHHGMSIK